jgi:glutathione S-transferase
LNALEELEIEYKPVPISIATGEQKSAQYLSINPFGKVPALTVDEKLLTENPAILIYLNTLVPGSKLLPLSDDAFHNSAVYSDLMWLSSSVHPSVRHVCVPAYYTTSKETANVVARGRIALKVYLDMAENRLADGQWWYGDRWSIVDTYLHWCYTRAQRGGYSIDDYPHLLRHRSQIEAMPSFQRRKKIEDSLS